ASWAAVQFATFLSNLSHRPKLALVLTQCDQYVDEIAERGGPRATLQYYQPDLMNQFPHLDVFDVAAVGQTMALSGSTFRVPITGFRSLGFEALLNWMVLEFVLGGIRGGGKAPKPRQVPKKSAQPASSSNGTNGAAPAAPPQDGS